MTFNCPEDYLDCPHMQIGWAKVLIHIQYHSDSKHIRVLELSIRDDLFVVSDCPQGLRGIAKERSYKTMTGAMKHFAKIQERNRNSDYRANLVLKTMSESGVLEPLGCLYCTHLERAPVDHDVLPRFPADLPMNDSCDGIVFRQAVFQRVEKALSVWDEADSVPGWYEANFAKAA